MARKTKLRALYDSLKTMDLRPIETAPADGRNMVVICEDGTVGTDSLMHYANMKISRQTGKDDGEGWSWYHASKSRRVLCCRPKRSAPPTPPQGE